MSYLTNCRLAKSLVPLLLLLLALFFHFYMYVSLLTTTTTTFIRKKTKGLGECVIYVHNCKRPQEEQAKQKCVHKWADRYKSATTNESFNFQLNPISHCERLSNKSIWNDETIHGKWKLNKTKKNWEWKSKNKTLFSNSKFKLIIRTSIGNGSCLAFLVTGRSVHLDWIESQNGWDSLCIVFIIDFP